MTLSGPELLTERHDVSSFACGKSALDHWLKTRALSNQRKGFTVVMVVHDAGRVVGFYGLALSAVAPATLSRAARTGQPNDPVPCLLLGQLATELEYAGRGVASGLLKHALGRCVDAARLVGGRALLANAIDGEAAAWWAARGFTASKDDPLLLFRSLADVAASLAASR